MNHHDLPDDMPLSDDPEENLRMENELLRLKLKAELGAESHNVTNLNPEIENEFLKHVLAFEHNFSHAKPAKVGDLLGNPLFVKSNELDDEALELALQQVVDLLTENNMEVYFGEGYDNRIQYEFITEELFEHETTFMPMPGMTTHFDYEEFHPNHKNDINNRAVEFIEQWFKQSLDEKSWELASHFILPDKTILSKAEVAAQFKLIFDAYTSFDKGKYFIHDTGFQLDGENGIGHAEGGVIYEAGLENGEKVVIQGPFKLYMQMEHGWWSIFHIVFPGFTYF